MGAAFGVGAVQSGRWAERQRAEYERLAPERRVAALGGIGAGWIDTLRRVAGPAEVDTLTAEMGEHFNGTLCGLYEQWYDRVRVSTDMRTYDRLLRALHETEGRGMGWYQHPVQLSTPAAVIAHEFGHRLQDSFENAPQWANNAPEVFADRFALAMLAVRGWLDAERADPVLLAIVRHRLRMSYIVTP